MQTKWWSGHQRMNEPPEVGSRGIQLPGEESPRVRVHFYIVLRESQKDAYLCSTQANDFSFPTEVSNYCCTSSICLKLGT